MSERILYPEAITGPSDLVALGCIDCTLAASDLTQEHGSYRRGFALPRGSGVFMTARAAASCAKADLKAVLREALRVTERWGLSNGMGGFSGERNTYRRDGLIAQAGVPPGLMLWALPTQLGGRVFVIHVEAEPRVAWVPAECRYSDEGSSA